MNYVNIALPKGRLGESVYNILDRLGYGCADTGGRKLIFESQNGVRFFWVKPSDVAVYVEQGAADLGVVGKDILQEYRPDVYELADLGVGKCRMAVAAKRGFCDDVGRTLRVATKFPHVAREYYSDLNRSVEILKLNGSIELAPILGMTDVIVDIVETGRTLKDNGLEVVSEIFQISARLIANKSSFKFKTDSMREIRDKIVGHIND